MLDERWPDDAEDLAGGLATILTKHCTSAHVRMAESTSDGRDRALEATLVAFGLEDVVSDPILAARAALELGRFMAPVTFVERAPVAAVLGHTGTAYGLEGPVPASIPYTAIRTPTGVAVMPTAGVPRRSAAGDLLVAPPVLGETTHLGGSEEADRMWRLARLFGSARLVGAARALVALGVEYAKSRSQFGRPIGSFQAVANRLVNSAIALDGADLLVRKAASLAAQSDDQAPPAHFAIMARAKAVSASRLVATNVHQVMGGYGFAMEYDCQLASRRIRSWCMRFEPAGPELRQLALMTLDPLRREGLTALWQHSSGLAIPRWAAEVDSASF